MEFSGNIDWKRLDAEVKISDWSLTEELFKNHSLQKHVDNDDMLKNCDTDKKQDKNISTVCDVILKAPEPRTPYPKISALSIEEQKYFLDNYKEYIYGNDIGCENFSQLQNLMLKLFYEQEEFLRFLQQDSLSAKDDYNFLHSQARNEIQDVLQVQRCQVQQELAPLYTLFQTVGLSSGAVFPNDPILNYNRTLKRAVAQSLLSLPDMKKRHKSLLESYGTDISTRYISSHLQICQDSTACKLAAENAVHFVLTAEALQTLIDNHPPEYEKYWELPITVIGQLKDSSETTSDCLKTIMIDDPLPSKSIEPREANVMYYRHKVCDVLGNNSQGIFPDVSGKTHEEQEIMDECSNSTMQGNCLGTDEDFDMSREKEKTFDSKTNLHHVTCKTKGCNTTNDGLTEAQFTYSLWTFGNINLLIRSKDCGLLKQGNKDGKGSLYPVNVFVKPEYQLTYGYERLTKSEASKWWINTYINPDSLCICARIDPITSQLLRTDVLNQASILTVSSFDPAKPMKMIHGTLTRLEKLLKSGKYILSHSAKDMHIRVYEAMDSENGGQAKNASYNLHLEHAKDGEVLVNYEKYVPWVPVDPNVFLDWHIAHHRIPLTFPPVTAEELKKITKQRNASVGKKKWKGKKGKNTQTGGFKGKGQMESKLLRNTKAKMNKKQTIHSDKQVENENDFGISQRLRSRGRPVTYDDIEFDF